MNDEYLARVCIEVLERLVELYSIQDGTGDFPESEWNSVREQVFRALKIVSENGYTTWGDYNDKSIS